ncbi:ATP-binding cassette domain-containing protein [Paenibacillus sp. GCM10023252]|uniref:ATP-binding cassette domain-containing protein n=1 Tax=Paenibacillus sp. GCM10023252 TaxID=3252649 RepID=UPI003623678D
MIELKDVNKRYRRKTVLNGVSFTAEKGQVTCLIGINGVGKSTVMKAIMGLTPVDRGHIWIDGQKMGPKLYEKVSFIPDTITMPPNMTIKDCMVFMSDFYDSWNQSRADEMLCFFKLDAASKVSELSKGTAAKLHLLLGLSLDADYVLMDEPFSGIDVFSREQIAKVFTSHLIEDRGVLITTHEIGDIEHLIDKVVILEQGTVVKEFYCEEVREEEGKSVMDVLREVYNG